MSLFFASCTQRSQIPKGLKALTKQRDSLLQELKYQEEASYLNTDIYDKKHPFRGIGWSALFKMMSPKDIGVPITRFGIITARAGTDSLTRPY